MKTSVVVSPTPPPSSDWHRKPSLIFIHDQLDLVGLPHSTFSDAAINLVCRSSEGTLRAVKNLCIGSMIETGREGTKVIDTKQVNAVLLQPHWRSNQQQEPRESVFLSNQNAEQK